MRLGPFGIWELLVIAVLVLLLFGPRKLPEMARSLAQALRDFQRGLNEVSRDLQEELTDAVDSPQLSGDQPQRSGAAQQSSLPASADAPAEATGARITAPAEETRSR